MQTRPDAASDPWARAMRAQDFVAAWRIADRVLAARDPTTRDDPHLPYHLRWVWDGTPPDGRRVLVRCYHGLGDTLQFARFLPALRRRATHVTLEVQPELYTLLAKLEGVDRLTRFDPARPHPPSDCDVEIMELAHLLRALPDDVRGCVPYLRCPAPRDPEQGARGALALCWQAGGWDPGRSIPLPDLLAACASPGRRLVSLQRGPQAAQATDAAFVNPRDTDPDVARTAALACAASLVVTVDTMVAHLAGALGRPTVLLLKRDADWRWPAPGQASAWYPTMTILGQRAPGQWREPLRELARLVGLEARTRERPA